MPRGLSRTGDVVVGTDGCGASAVGVGEYPDVGRVFLSRLDVLKAFHLENLRSLGVFVHGECVGVAAGLLFFNVAEGADGQDHAVIVGKVAVLKCFFLTSGGMRPGDEMNPVPRRSSPSKVALVNRLLTFPLGLVVFRSGPLQT